MMTPIFDLLSRWPGGCPATIVHLGAGRGVELEDYAKLSPGRAVLVEGDADTVIDLRANARVHRWAEVHAVVVAPQSAELPWHRFNVSALNGPADPTGLTAFYPRLRATDSTQAHAVSLSEFLQGLELPDQGDHLLVVDLPGQEMALLASLPQALLNRFAGIVLRGCGVKTPGLGDAVETMARQLKSRYFKPIAATADAEPLWPVHLLVFDEGAQERDQLQVHVQALHDELREAQARQAEFDALHQAHEQLQRDHAAEMSGWQVHAQQAAEREAKLDHELAEARQTASLSVKLQLLREADLRDLQARYREVQQQHQQQHELLTKLAQRLSLATQYFEQLSFEQRHEGLVEHNDSTVA
jgi:hypothetical protein